MKEKSAADIYYTQGEYVTYFDKDFISSPLDEAAAVRESAPVIAKEKNKQPRQKQGQGISRGRKTITLPKQIWKEAYSNLKQ